MKWWWRTQSSAYVWKSSSVCIMRSCDEELSPPECYYISTFSTLLSQCARLEAGGQRTEQWVAGEQQLGCTEAGPPSPSQGLFSALCRYQVDIQYLQIWNIYSCCIHLFILTETDFLKGVVWGRLISEQAPAPGPTVLLLAQLLVWRHTVETTLDIRSSS